MTSRILLQMTLMGLAVECVADTWTKLSPLPTGNHLHSIFFAKPKADSASGALAKVGDFPKQSLDGGNRVLPQGKWGI